MPKAFFRTPSLSASASLLAPRDLRQTGVTRYPALLPNKLDVRSARTFLPLNKSKERLLGAHGFYTRFIPIWQQLSLFQHTDTLTFNTILGKTL